MAVRYWRCVSSSSSTLSPRHHTLPTQPTTLIPIQRMESIAFHFKLTEGNEAAWGYDSRSQNNYCVIIGANYCFFVVGWDDDGLLCFSFHWWATRRIASVFPLLLSSLFHHFCELISSTMRFQSAMNGFFWRCCWRYTLRSSWAMIGFFCQ